MKLYFALITIILVMSCKQKDTTHNKISIQRNTWLIRLESNLGQLKINLPQRFDTTFKWIEYSDCGSCDYFDYRVQNKSLPIFKESGFYYFPLKDSVEQFTIKHHNIVDTLGSIENDFKPLLKHEGIPVSYIYKKEQVLIDTQIVINKRYFNIVSTKYFDSTQKVSTATLNTAFLIKSNLIKLSFEYRKSYPDTSRNNFFQESLEAVKSIEIL